MAWNPSPEVAAARDAAKKLDDAPMVVLIYVSRKGGIGMASYGKTMALCRSAGKLGDYLFEAAKKWGSE